jgi:LuxR family transcriptional regulator, regulator of acetate metabolism
LSATIEQPRRERDQDSFDPVAVHAAITAAEKEERLAAECNGHVRGETLGRLRDAQDAVRAQLEQNPQAPIVKTIKWLRLLADLEEIRQRIEAHEGYAKLDAFVRIQEGLERLRQLTTPQELIEAAPGELVRTLGFTRVMVSRVRGSLWTPEVLEVVDGIDPEAEAFKRFVAEEEIPLAHMLMETELVRRRMPVLLSDPAAHPRTYKPIVEVSRSPSYAAAPIMPTTRVIGFFHVDRFGQELPVGPEDRDNLWVFAEHFGLLYERSVLVERLESQRCQLHDLLSETIVAIDDICATDVRLARAEQEAGPATAGGLRRAARSPLDALLTAREQEVIELMASGATNNQIARELVVSEGTVKSHVKRILRKLRVDNRAGAVARYLHLMRRTGR